ncbi:uncharacterized [Tachysurus ichikawai]
MVSVTVAEAYGWSGRARGHYEKKERKRTTSSCYIFQANTLTVNTAKDRHAQLAESWLPSEDLQPAICAMKNTATLAFLGQI